MIQYLSYIIDEQTPTYGNRDSVKLIKKSSLANDEPANNTHIQTTTHVGTHVDMPYHFFEDGQTIRDFEASFWFFTNPLFVEITPKDFVVHDELINKLTPIDNKSRYDILIVKTGMCNKRDHSDFGEKNVGFAPEISDYLRNNFPNVRIFGFDSVSVSSFQARMIGREAHRAFLNPKHPIILLEDMDLKDITNNTVINELIISPLRISQSDGIPVTIMVKISL